MFDRTIEQIFTKDSMSYAFEDISSTSFGMDEVSYADFKKDFSKNINGLIFSIQNQTYSPEPLKNINISKENGSEARPIGISSIKDKLIQKVLYLELNQYFDNIFLSNSYAYRPNKSTYKAINRATNFINEGSVWVLKTDIKDFFESIDHSKLLQILLKHIKDKRIVDIISLFLKTGGFFKGDFKEHKTGVHQGDILSPMLSNIYLDLMDRFIDKNGANFVRYADDFVVFFDSEEKALGFKPRLVKFLKLLNLSLNEQKTKISNIKDGFVFLGVNFLGKHRFLDDEKIQRSISRLRSINIEKTDFEDYVGQLNTYLLGLKNYYIKIIPPQSSQILQIKENFIDSISQKVCFHKQNKSIKSKKEFITYLEKIKFDILFNKNEINNKISLILTKGYEKYLSKKTYRNESLKINKKRNLYASKIAVDSTLHINQVGIHLGISKNKFSIKQYGKLYKDFPISKISRIIIDSEYISISSAVIHRCAKEKIHIDFIDKHYNPYATLLTYNSVSTQAIHRQAMLLGTPSQLYLASQFVISKIKNQTNYLKYLNKYHKFLTPSIRSLENILIKKIKYAKTTNELLGFEGSAAAIYWDSIKSILPIEFEKRVTLGAKDVVNSSLNYAYAILYSKVQECLYRAGLSLHISFLHSTDSTKPTLVFDMIEQFRAFMVDRVVISMINKDSPIKLNKEGLLTDESKKLIAQNIKKKLGSYTMWKKQSCKCENIIQSMCYELSNFINGTNKYYKPFIGKF
ncbi:CRISPR-associated endonuclease Cas1 [Campylobacter sp. RM15925]|uniref:CRISPR-associated endonuclease Cas1 n=1 Tax=Campylobacter sp. RM15925 TaxID=1705724 RepID=UPI001474A07E|nr:CRISPR-associated endonuclease Cas1 [Campylobacter sp. RM15925]